MRTCLPVCSGPHTRIGYVINHSTVKNVLGSSSVFIEQGVKQRGLISRARRGAALKELESTREEEKEAQVPTVKKLEWESPMQIIRYPDPRLRAQNSKIGIFDESLERLAEELLETMYKGNDGVGLAAPQVGVNLRLMVFNPTGVRGDPDYVLVNPSIISSKRKAETEEEGCLSFPNIFGEVQRHTHITVRAQDLKGEKVVMSLQGWNARIFQHEYDHLQGVLFHDRMAPEVVKAVQPQLVSLEQEFQKQNPGVRAESVQ